MLYSSPYQLYPIYHLPLSQNILYHYLHIYLLVEPNEPSIEKIHHRDQKVIMEDYLAPSILEEIHLEPNQVMESQIEALSKLMANASLTFSQIM